MFLIVLSVSLSAGVYINTKSSNSPPPARRENIKYQPYPQKILNILITINATQIFFSYFSSGLLVDTITPPSPLHQKVGNWQNKFPCLLAGLATMKTAFFCPDPALSKLENSLQIKI